MKRLLFLILGIATPRLTILILWLFSGWFTNVFKSAFWPVLGFFITPYTLLWYSAMQNWFHGAWTTPNIIVLIVAIIFDLTPAKRLLKR